MPEVYKGKKFGRFAKKAHLSDVELWKAAQEANDGLIDADLGGGVIKKRIARPGEGKSGGARSIIVFRRNDLAVFVHGFEKKNTANIGLRELEALRRLAQQILGYTSAELGEKVEEGALLRITRPKEEEDA